MEKWNLLILLLFSSVPFVTKAATVDTVSIYSNAMKKAFNCVVVKPDSYNKTNRSFPAVYVLHGRGGNYSEWIRSDLDLKNYSDQYQMIIVSPEGQESWFLDSPIDSSIRFETYIANEVVVYIDSHYRTIKSRYARAITGISMGGHGALFLGFRHTNIFGACGGISGGPLDFNTALNKVRHIKNLGDTVQNAGNWKSLSVTSIIENYSTKDSLAIIFDCGLDDPFYPVNKKLHEKMLELKIPHDYIERPGIHNQTYFTNSAKFQMLFFRKYFDKNKQPVTSH